MIPNLCCTLGDWLTGSSNPQEKVNVLISGFGSTRQRDHGGPPISNLPRKLLQGNIEIQADEQ